MPLPENLKGESWTPSIARRLLPLLVSYAEACQPVTYGELSKEAMKRKWSHYVMPVTYRHPCGAIGYAIEKTEEEWQNIIPPINAIVINENTGMPGDGVDYFLKTYLRLSGTGRQFTVSQRESIVEEIHKDVFNYTGWRHLLRYYELSDPPKLRQSQISFKPKHKYNWSGESESDLHKKLKIFVANNPWVVNLPRTTPKGQMEYILPSADKIDVLFKDGLWDVAIEVKALNANNDDLLRGIYQCVKYRELLRAEKRVIGAIPQARALLVTERSLPSEHQRIADTLKVECKKIKLTTVSRRRMI